MNNTDFLNKLTESFHIYLNTNSRSNKKLKPVHEFIADSLADFFSANSKYSYSFCSLRKATNGGEKKIEGRYIEKQVDIAILRDTQPIAGIGFKFVMSNYAQNSNNYFENMLGETANIRCNNLAYFQILVLL